MGVSYDTPKVFIVGGFMGKKFKIGDIQVLLSASSVIMSIAVLVTYGRIAAISAYVDPITTKQESVEVFEEITIESEEDDIFSQRHTLELKDEEETEDFYDPDPLSYTIDVEDGGMYFEEVDTTYTPLPNGLTREYVTIHSDVCVETCPSIEVLDKLIDWWDPRIMENKGTTFKGHGKDFYAVWEMTGMDPLIILGIAAWEGGWGNSKLAVAKHNYYGIGAYDSDPMYWASRFVDEDSELSEFDQVSKGIIDGAVWIYENYYTKGNTTLALINQNGYNGYNGGTYWAETITEQMINVHYRVVADIIKEAN